MNFSEFQRVIDPNHKTHPPKKDVPTLINSDYILLFVEKEIAGKKLVIIEMDNNEKLFVSDSLNFIYNYKINQSTFLNLELYGQRSKDGTGEFFEHPFDLIVNFNFVKRFAETNKSVPKEIKGYTNHKLAHVDLVTLELCTSDEIVVKGTRAGILELLAKKKKF